VQAISPPGGVLQVRCADAAPGITNKRAAHTSSGRIVRTGLEWAFIAVLLTSRSCDSLPATYVAAPRRVLWKSS
jgi:hypothetical protein